MYTKSGIDTGFKHKHHWLRINTQIKPCKSMNIKEIANLFTNGSRLTASFENLQINEFFNCNFIESWRRYRNHKMFQATLSLSF